MGAPQEFFGAFQMPSEFRLDEEPEIQRVQEILMRGADRGVLLIDSRTYQPFSEWELWCDALYGLASAADSGYAVGVLHGGDALPELEFFDAGEAHSNAPPLAETPALSAGSWTFLRHDGESVTWHAAIDGTSLSIQNALGSPRNDLLGVGWLTQNEDAFVHRDTGATWIDASASAGTRWFDHTKGTETLRWQTRAENRANIPSFSLFDWYLPEDPAFYAARDVRSANRIDIDFCPSRGLIRLESAGYQLQRVKDAETKKPWWKIW